MAIKISNNIVNNVVLKSRFLGAAVFIGVGAGKTIQDYYCAKPEDKSKVLLKDASILTGSLVAFTLVSPLTKFFCDTKFVNFFVESTKYIVSKITKKTMGEAKVLNNTKKVFQCIERVIKDAIAGTLNVCAGIIGAVYANELMHKFVLNKPPFVVEKSNESLNNRQSENLSTTNQENNEVLKDNSSLKNTDNIETTTTQLSDNSFFDKEQKKKNVFKNFHYDYSNAAKVTANRVFSTVSDLPEMKILTKSSMALTGFSVANVDGYHNKLKKMTYELLANTMIPTLFVSAASIFVENKKASIKLPVLIATILTGIYTGQKCADKLKTKMDTKIDKINMKYIKL